MSSEGETLRVLLLPVDLGGEDIPENRVPLPTGAAHMLAERLFPRLIEIFRQGVATDLEINPIYKGRESMPTRIEYIATKSGTLQFKATLRVSPANVDFSSKD